MFNFLEKMRDGRERAAFITALVLTLAVGAVWFRLSFPSAPPTLATEPTAPMATAVRSVNDTSGPFSRLGEEIGDAAIFIAAQAQKIGALWKGWSLQKPVEFERPQDAF